MISLIGGELYQWDTGRIVRIDPDENVAVHEVHFTTKRMDYAYVLKTYIEDGVTYCAIPNIILQQSYRLLCYEVCENSDGEETIANASFNIVKRNRPEDYVYTEQEHFTFVKLENRLDAVEESAHIHENKTELDTITEEDLEIWRNPNSSVVAGGAQVGTLFKDFEVTTTLADDASEWTGASSQPFKCTFRPSPGQTVFASVGDSKTNLATFVNISPEGDSSTKTIVGNYSVVNSRLKTWYNDGDHNPSTPNCPDLIDYCFVFEYDDVDYNILTPGAPMCTLYTKAPGTYKVTLIAMDYSIDPLSVTSMYNVSPYTLAEYGTYANWKELTESGKYDLWEVGVKKSDYYNGVYLKEIDGTKYVYVYRSEQKEDPETGTFTNTDYTLTYDTATETVTCSDAALNPETDIIISVHRDYVLRAVPDKATSLGEATPDKVGKMLTAVDVGGTYNKWQNSRYQYRWVDAPTSGSGANSFTVAVTNANNVFTADKTLAEIEAAVSAGSVVRCYYLNEYYLNLWSVRSGANARFLVEDSYIGETDGYTYTHFLTFLELASDGTVNLRRSQVTVLNDRGLEATYAKKTEIPTVPTKVSAFENDSGYLTEHQSLTDYAKKTEIPTKTSQLTNDSGYLTEHQSLEAYAKKTDITQPDWNQNDQTASDYIKNRIGGYETIIDPITISWDGNTEGKTVVADQLYLVSNETPTINQLIGGIIKYVIVKNGETTSENLTITEDVIGSHANGNITIGEFCAIIHSPGTVGNATFKKSGIYFTGMFSETKTVYVNELTTVGGIAIVKIPEKYLDAATKDEVTTAQTTADAAKNTADAAKNTADAAKNTAESKLNSNNPIGTGSLSLNRHSMNDIGDYSVAAGQYPVASGIGSVAFGYRYNYAQANGAFVCGGAGNYLRTSDTESNRAQYSSGESSFVCGSANTASGDQSFAAGLAVRSKGNQQFVEGKYNVPDSENKYAHIIGNGTNYTTGISNASTIDWSGNAWFSGEVYVGSTSGINKDDGSKKLATEDYVTSQFKSLPVDGTTIKLNDQGQLTLALSNANGVNF